MLLATTILTIPASRGGIPGAQIPLHYSDLQSHGRIELVAVPRHTLGSFLSYFSSFPSAQVHQKAIDDLIACRLLTVDVPVLVTLGSADDQPSCYRRLELLSALSEMGFEQLPVLANAAAAGWLATKEYACSYSAQSLGLAEHGDHSAWLANESLQRRDDSTSMYRTIAVLGKEDTD